MERQDIIKKVLTKILSEKINNYNNEDYKNNINNINIFDSASTCLLLSEVQENVELNGGCNWDEMVFINMKEIKKILDVNGFAIPPSNFRGNIEIGFAILSLKNKTDYYNKFLNGLNELILKQTKIKLKLAIDKKEEITIEDYDIINGLAGICLYLINFKEDSRILQCIKDILNYLVSICYDINMEDKCIPGFYIKYNNQTYYNLEQFPSGSFNFGLSHGIAGVLAVLSICISENIEVEGQRKSIQRILNIFKKYSIKYENAIYWPGIISLEDFCEDKYDNINFRASWCYGTPGIARAIFLGSLIVNDNEAKELSLKAFEYLCINDINSLVLESPTICHGYSGILSIMYLMYEDTKNVLFKNVILKFIDEIGSYYKEDSRYGFQDISRYMDEIEVEDKICFLEGATGVALTLLLSLKKNKPIWLRQLGLY